MLKSCIGVLAFLILALAMSSAGYGARPDLIEVVTGDHVFRGKAVAHDKSDFWLLQQDGRMRRLPINSVARFRSVAPQFQGFRAAEMKRELRKEFGKGFEVVSTQHYVVAGPSGRARRFADAFESMYRTFRTSFAARGFRLETPDFPLVAVVFKHQEQFVKYAKRDGVANAVQILGYYHLGSNRVALFDEPNAKLTRLGPGDGNVAPGATGRRAASATPPFPIVARAGGVNPTLEETIIHEGTHQAAFNTGLHTRIGQNPRWVVEGLATVFEAPGIRNRSGGRGAKSRINQGRYLGFRRYVAAGRSRGSLKVFIAQESLFTTNIYHFYSEAWALSFFLLETRSSQYSKYLKTLAGRNPLAPYSARERLADFQQAFGQDLDRLERDYLRFIGGL